MGLKSMDLETLVGNVVQTTSNVGGDVGLALPLVGNDAPFRGLTAGANVTLTVLGDSSIEIASPDAGQTPWLQDVDADDFSLNNLTNLVWTNTTVPTTPAADHTTLWAQKLFGLTALRFVGDDGEINDLLQSAVLVVRNEVGSTLTKGQAVYVNGSNGGLATVSLSRADTTTTIPAIGVIKADISNGTNGFVLVSGILTDGIDTSTWAVGDLLYVSDSVAGDLTNVAPLHPSLTQLMGIVLTVGVNGSAGYFTGQVSGAEAGTITNDFLIGDALAGTKSLTFTNLFDGTVQMTPTANRVITIPDVTDILVGKNTSDIFTNKTIDDTTNDINGVFDITGLTTQTQALNMGNFLITNLADPVSGSDATNKDYVDNLAQGTSWKEAATVATTANITLSGEQTIDNVLTSSDRVLVKDQTLGEENGVYDSQAGAWVRSTDVDTGAEIAAMSIFITSGTLNNNTSWVLTTDPPITIDVTVLVYGQIGGTGSPVNTKGDMYGFSTQDARIPVGTDGQVLKANSSEALGVDWQDNTFTPWVVDIDAAGFDLRDLSNLEFQISTLSPAGTIPAIHYDADGLNINVPTGDKVKFLFNDVESQAFYLDHLDMVGTFIDNAIYLESNDAATSQSGFIRMASLQFIGIRNNADTVDLIAFGVNGDDDTVIGALSGDALNIEIVGVNQVIVDETDVDFIDHNLLQLGYADFSQIVAPATPPLDTCRVFADPDTQIAGDEPRLLYKDDSGVIRDISSGGYQVQNYDSDDAKSNEYFALNGPKDGKANYTDREIAVPRSTRWYNLYVIIALNTVNTAVTFDVYVNTIITALTLTIPALTTGTFSNITTTLDVAVGDTMAYRMGSFGGGNITLNAAGMAMDMLRQP